jgi:hypothetical protein
MDLVTSGTGDLAHGSGQGQKKQRERERRSEKKSDPSTASDGYGT